MQLMDLLELAFLLFVMKPLLLGKAAILTWLRLTKAMINFQADLLYKLVTWSISCVTLPIRIVTALQREKILKTRLRHKRIEVEDLIWENHELEEKLEMAMKDCRVMENMFTELEYDYEIVLSRIEKLEHELHKLKDENIRLSEVQGKIRCQYESEKEDDEAHAGIPLSLKFGITNVGDSLAERRSSALSQSLFSSILSLLVGAIIWQAEDPCMPLVVALFMVVGMSLSTVVQFFSTIKNKPASDAVVLLSFNWFILGTLSSSTLPRVARLFAHRD